MSVIHKVNVRLVLKSAYNRVDYSAKYMEPGDAWGSNGEIAMMGVCSPMEPPGVRVVSVHTDSSSRCTAACKSSSFSSSNSLFDPSPFSWFR